MNIHSLYVTRSKSERDYFYKLLEFLRDKPNVKIVHLDFKHSDTVGNLKENTKPIRTTVYNPKDTYNPKDSYKTNIITFEDLVRLFEFKDNSLPNAFVYSGHSNGLLLMKHNIRILTIEDFCELSVQTIHKKADVFIFDCCLCGNISVLNAVKDSTKYVIASSSYWSELSILYTHSIFDSTKDLQSVLVNAIKEFIYNEEQHSDAFVTDIMLYSINDSLLELIKLVLTHKDTFTSKDYIIDKTYYKDIYCLFKGIGIDIQGLLDKFVIFKRFDVKKCHARLKSKKDSSSWPSELSIILRNPVKNEIANKFFR